MAAPGLAIHHPFTGTVVIPPALWDAVRSWVRHENSPFPADHANVTACAIYVRRRATTDGLDDAAFDTLMRLDGAPALLEAYGPAWVKLRLETMTERRTRAPARRLGDLMPILDETKPKRRPRKLAAPVGKRLPNLNTTTAYLSACFEGLRTALPPSGVAYLVGFLHGACDGWRAADHLAALDTIFRLRNSSRDYNGRKKSSAAIVVEYLREHGLADYRQDFKRDRETP